MAKKAVEIAERVFGNQSLETARALKNLGFIQFAANDHKAAEDIFEKTLNIYKKLSNLTLAEGASLAEMIEYLAFIKYKNQSNDAEKLFELALQWFEKTGGADSVKTSKSLYALANINYWKGNYKKSAEFYLRLLEIASKNPNSEVDLTMAYSRTECAYGKAGMEDEFEAVRSKYAVQVKITREDSRDENAAQANVLQSGVVNGKAIELSTPMYPAEARRVRARGKIEVKVIINKEGKVIYACAVKGNAALIEASEAAAYRSRFFPTQLDGKPITVSGIIIYNFVP